MAAVKKRKKNLVIVESPAKVKTIRKFLGSNYDVAASNGHVRDLPKSKLGVDVEHDYEPHYITIRGKGELLAGLRKQVKKPDPWLPRIRKSHVHEFFAAIREGRRANADFSYGVPLVKTVLLGNVLAQTGVGRLDWDGARVTNNPSANAYLKTTYRKGWELPAV